MRLKNQIPRQIMFFDKATLSPRKIVVCKVIVTIAEKSASPTLMKMPFTHKVILAQWVYTSSETQNKNGVTV
jgi:hypothetical protein